MPDLLTPLWNLCRLRGGPQDFPWSPRLLLVLLLADVALDAVVGAWLGVGARAMTASAVATLVLLGFLYVLLSAHQRGARFVQAATALATAALFFSVLAIPAQLALPTVPADPALLTPRQGLALAWAAALGGWSLVVTAYVLRHALERGFMYGLALAVLMNLTAGVAAQWTAMPAVASA